MIRHLEARGTLALALVIVMAMVAASCSGGPGEEPPLPSPEGSASAASEDSGDLSSFVTIADMVEHSLPAVVSILTGAVDLRQFLDPSIQREGGGTGVIIDSEGLIVTNSHVIADSNFILVTLADGRTFDAEMVGHDPLSDLAVIRIQAGTLPVLAFGDSNQLRVGETVVAIGNALALEGGPTVTAGVVSALKRSISLSDGMLNDLVQTDAAINPGNSGGPLLNMQGEVVGINTALDRQSPGIGFAVGTDTIHRVVDQLITMGEVARGFLGVTLATVNPALSARFDLGVDEGVILINVLQDTPAFDAGLRRQDVVISFIGETVTTVDELIFLIRTSPIGEELDLTYIRSGEEFTISVTLRERE
ncbi:MAG: trypsin-like peptidase domain-containing protein [Dehalococcoidia bacterium]